MFDGRAMDVNPPSKWENMNPREVPKRSVPCARLVDPELVELAVNTVHGDTEDQFRLRGPPDFVLGDLGDLGLGKNRICYQGALINNRSPGTDCTYT